MSWVQPDVTSISKELMLLSYDSVVPIHGYTILRPGSSRVSVGLRNISCQKITNHAKSMIAKVTAANVIPHSMAPNRNLRPTTELRDLH